MTTNENPADAVREALDRYSFGPQYAELSGAFLGNGMDKDADGSWVRHADHARVIAALTARVEKEEKLSAHLNDGCVHWQRKYEDAAARLAALAGAAPVGEVQRASPEVMIGALDQSKVKPGDKLFTHAPAKAREVTDEMVERCVEAYHAAGLDGCETLEQARTKAMRAALATFAEGAGHD